MRPANRFRELLALAENDYQAALILARAEDPQMDASGFHLQQTIEGVDKTWDAKIKSLTPILICSKQVFTRGTQ